MYLDAIKKINFYKDEIIQNMIKSGVYPNSQQINAMLASIDENIALFESSTNMSNGENLNISLINENMKRIYSDLKILYEVMYELTNKRYIEIVSFADCKLQELRATADMYQKRSAIETNSTALGDTVFFASGSYNISDKNNQKIIRLGSLLVHAGSNITCLVDAPETSASNIFFIMTEDSTELDTDRLTCNIYNYNQDFIKVPGNSKTTEYQYNIAAEQKTSGIEDINLKINSFVPSSKNNYSILSGRDKIKINQNAISSAQALNTIIENNSTIEFYTSHVNSITFKFNKSPLKMNIELDSNLKVSNLKSNDYIKIEVDAGTLMDISVESGNIYAYKNIGTIRDSELYTRSTNELNYLITEYSPGDLKTYYGFVTIINDDLIDYSDIASIAIKELVQLTGE